jgi:tetratricopeptide (TPR) repeat protein
MRNAWLTKFVAALSAVACTAAPGLASPAAMAMRPRQPAPATPPAPAVSSPAVAAAAPAVAVTPGAQPYWPSSQISPTKNPFKYFAASMAELPIRPNARTSANPLMQPVSPNNAVVAQAAAAGPPTPERLIALAQTSERQGDIQTARQHFGQALTMWPGHVEVLRAAARMEDRLGELTMAETLYQQAAQANPQHAGALNDLGLCLARQGKLDASIQVIEQAIQLQPEKPLYRNNAATVLVEMRQDQRALSHLTAVHGAAEANYNLGQLLVQRGRPAEATPYFQAAVQQNPQMQSAHVALARLQSPGTTPPSQAATPASNPEVAPQQTPPTGPRLDYPATARSPELGASTLGAPAYQAPPTSAPWPAAPANAAAPTRYLPPVASQPAGPIRR